MDCFSGAAGDMVVGACLDAGVDLSDLEQGLACLPLDGWSVSAEKTRRGGLAGTRFLVQASEGAPERCLRDIDRIVRAAGFAAEAEERMLRTFEALAQAEATAHGVGVEEVHFHEVGAIDAIIDVCAAVLAFDRLGVERVYCSEIVTGKGTLECAHGRLPVPAPGTLALLEGVPLRFGSVSGERLTPTGAALLRVLVDEFDVPISLRPLSVGYGVGSRDGGSVPNLLRLTVGDVEDRPGASAVWELSTNVDNVSGEVLAHALRLALDQGALDVWATPTVTKKSRPAHWIVALSDDAHLTQVEDVLLAELPTLGLRRQRVERRTLPRRIETRDTPFGDVRFKVRTLPDGTEWALPEWDDIERIAAERGISALAVQRSLVKGA
ncbi:MAG: nickel pincer cofactor biosynthesis protein LarC [Planctomycetota bacterium]|nr:nickel pincer cofactor biosynthesis protein LarC [Planctomycetota bacterium]